MSWLLIAVVAWAAVSAPLALLIGRSIRFADEALLAQSSPAVPDSVPVAWLASSSGSL